MLFFAAPNRHYLPFFELVSAFRSSSSHPWYLICNDLRLGELSDERFDCIGTDCNFEFLFFGLYNRIFRVCQFFRQTTYPQLWQSRDIRLRPKCKWQCRQAHCRLRKSKIPKPRRLLRRPLSSAFLFRIDSSHRSARNFKKPSMRPFPSTINFKGTHENSYASFDTLLLSESISMSS